MAALPTAPMGLGRPGPSLSSRRSRLVKSATVDMYAPEPLYPGQVTDSEQSQPSSKASRSRARLTRQHTTQISVCVTSDRGECEFSGSMRDVDTTPPSPSPRDQLLTHPKSAPARQESFMSCPDLTKDKLLKSGKVKVRKNNSADGCPERTGQVSMQKLLTVPDMFTTSFTHSLPSGSPVSSRSPSPHDLRQIPKAARLLGIGYHNSEPDLASTSRSAYTVVRGTLVKQTVKKSISASPPRTQNDDLNITFQPQPLIWHVCENIFLGNEDAMYDQALLCRNQIMRIVNSTNLSIEHRKMNATCTCSRDGCTGHKLTWLRVCLDLSDLKNCSQGPDLSSVNSFIQNSSDKNCLICCTSGRFWSVFLVLQFLIRTRSIAFKQAYKMIQGILGTIDLNKVQHTTLRAIEAQVRDMKPESSADESNDPRRTKSLPGPPKQAWAI